MEDPVNLLTSEQEERIDVADKSSAANNLTAKYFLIKFQDTELFIETDRFVQKHCLFIECFGE